MTSAQPRYRQIADELRFMIASGIFKAGDSLPTEMELCEAKNISRHTAREALRILTEDGLIARRRGAGTVVTTPPPPAFAQPIGDFESILQYARDATFLLEKVRPATVAETKRLGVDGDYTSLTGVRRTSGEAPLAVTTVLILTPLAPTMEVAQHLQGPISEWIEATHGVAVTKVVQRMEAVALSKTDAARLGVTTGTPALRTLRRYADTSGRPIVVSESLHPAGRFVYEMKLTRQKK